MLRTAISLLICAAAVAGTAHAAEPQVGGWRNLPIGPAYAVAEKQTPFVMLPADVAKGTRFKVMDLTRWQAVCCLEVTSPRLQLATLINSYQVPTVWASDMVGIASDAHVFAARRVDQLSSHVFEGHFTESGEMGGLLLPANAGTAGKGTVTMGGVPYAVTRTSNALADDDGELETYRLVPRDGKKPLTTEVRYGTN